METQLPQILLIDDDQAFCRMLVEYLQTEGLEVSAVHDGETGWPEAITGSFDLVILDIMLPGISGIEVLRCIRRESEVPVLMLTARGDELDRIIGLELGADDYLPKPCNPRELSARAHAVLRRTRNTQAVESASTALSLSAAKRTARWHGEPLDLTSTEFNVLKTLYENIGHTVSKTELANRALGRTPALYDRSLDVHVSNLRRKLGKLDSGRSPIQTIHGIGYQLLQE